MKKVISVLLSVLMLISFSACAQTEQVPEKTRFTKSYMDYFDTASTIVGYEETQEAFDEKCAFIEEQLKHYHELYDIYHWYEGVTNVYNINKEAGKAPVKVDEDIIALFEFCREMYDLTGGKTNFAMGTVLSIWHEYRENGNYDYFSGSSACGNA